MMTIKKNKHDSKEETLYFKEEHVYYDDDDDDGDLCKLQNSLNKSELN